MVTDPLQDFGLNEHERLVYLEVLKSGKVEPSRVAKTTGVNRTSVYSIATKLERLGLIRHDLGSKKTYLVAEDPSALKDIVAKEEARLQTQKKVVDGMIATLRALAPNPGYSIPRIKVVEEADLNPYLYRQSPEWVASGHDVDSTWWGFHDHTCTVYYGDWIDWLWAKDRGDGKVRFFTNAAPEEIAMDAKHPERITRPLPNSELDCSVWILGHYVLLVKTRERPHYLVEIYDAVLARNLRSVFKSFWAMSEPSASAK